MQCACARVLHYMFHVPSNGNNSSPPFHLHLRRSHPSHPAPTKKYHILSACTRRPVCSRSRMLTTTHTRKVREMPHRTCPASPRLPASPLPSDVPTHPCMRRPDLLHNHRAQSHPRPRARSTRLGGRCSTLSDSTGPESSQEHQGTRAS